MSDAQVELLLAVEMKNLGHEPGKFVINQAVRFIKCAACGAHAIKIFGDGDDVRTFGTALESPCDPRAVNKTIKFER